MAKKTFNNLSKGSNALANDLQSFLTVDVYDNSKPEKEVKILNLEPADNLYVTNGVKEEKEIEQALENESDELMELGRGEDISLEPEILVEPIVKKKTEKKL